MAAFRAPQASLWVPLGGRCEPIPPILVQVCCYALSRLVHCSPNTAPLKDSAVSTVSRCRDASAMAEVTESCSAAPAAEAIIYINGKRYKLPAGRGEATLLTFLRGKVLHVFLRLMAGHVCVPLSPMQNSYRGTAQHGLAPAFKGTACGSTRLTGWLGGATCGAGACLQRATYLVHDANAQLARPCTQPCWCQRSSTRRRELNRPARHARAVVAVSNLQTPCTACVQNMGSLAPSWAVERAAAAPAPSCSATST